MIEGRAPAIDTLFRFPSEEEDSATIAARKLTRDSASHGYTKHPAGYLFDEKKGVQGQAATADEMVAMMDRFNVRLAQIDVNPLDPDPVLAILERYPTRFFGEIRVDSNAGMVAVRQIDELTRAHRNIRSVMLYPCLCNPQVPIDDKKHYPIYAKCSELGIPVSVLGPLRQAAAEMAQPVLFDLRLGAQALSEERHGIRREARPRQGAVRRLFPLDHL
jgi:predicted TIM-barrel fold metal-dependent hydrolase